MIGSSESTSAGSPSCSTRSAWRAAMGFLLAAARLPRAGFRARRAAPRLDAFPRAWPVVRRRGARPQRPARPGLPLPQRLRRPQPDATASSAGPRETTPWMVYGRLGVFNFQDYVDQSRSEGRALYFSPYRAEADRPVLHRNSPRVLNVGESQRGRQRRRNRSPGARAGRPRWRSFPASRTSPSFPGWRRAARKPCRRSARTLTKPTSRASPSASRR